MLLKYVGKAGYVDPACGLKDAALDPEDPHSQGGKADQRHSACDLNFGTSTGALGIRKFPNPRFDAAKWQALNGGNASWAGFNATKGDWPANWGRFRGTLNGPQTPSPTDAAIRIVVGEKARKGS